MMLCNGLIDKVDVAVFNAAVSDFTPVEDFHQKGEARRRRVDHQA